MQKFCSKDIYWFISEKEDFVIPTIFNKNYTKVKNLLTTKISQHPKTQGLETHSLKIDDVQKLLEKDYGVEFPHILDCKGLINVYKIKGFKLSKIITDEGINYLATQAQKKMKADSTLQERLELEQIHETSTNF